MAAGNLLAARGFNDEAQEACRLGVQLWPDSPDAVGDLADLLARRGQENEARTMQENFVRQHPDQR